TAGVFSAISAPLVQELGLHKRPIRSHEIYDMAGKKIESFVSIDEMLLGPVRAPNSQLMVVTELGPGIDGILGPDYLKNFDLDFDKRELNLISQDHCKGRVVYWTDYYVNLPFRLGQGDHIEFSVMLDGQKLSAVLDTGAWWTVLSMTSARAA